MYAFSPDHTPARHNQLVVHMDRTHPNPPTKQIRASISPHTRPTSLFSPQATTLTSPPSTPVPPATTSATTPKSVKATQSRGVLNLDDPHLPIHAAQWSAENLAGELVCRFRAIQTPPHLFKPINWGVFGEVIVDTPCHLHINVKFEHLHMMDAIKQAWVNTHIKPDTECVLRLGGPVLNEARELHIQEKSRNLVEALFPQEEAESASVGESSSLCQGPTSPMASLLAESVVQSVNYESSTELDQQEVSAHEVRRSAMISIGTQTEDTDDSSDMCTPRPKAKKAKAKKSESKSHQKRSESSPAGPQAVKVRSANPQKESWAQIVSRH